MKPKTYVHRRGHKKHRFLKSGKYRIGKEFLYIWKCKVCGDITIKIEKINKTVT